MASLDFPRRIAKSIKKPQALECPAVRVSLFKLFTLLILKLLRETPPWDNRQIYCPLLHRLRLPSSRL